MAEIAAIVLAYLFDDVHLTAFEYEVDGGVWGSRRRLRPLGNSST